MANLSFKYLGKTYDLPEGFAQRDISTLKNFLKSFNEWKSKGGTIESYLRLPGRGPRFDEQEGRIWRRLIDFAESGGKSARRAPSEPGIGAKYIKVFNELKFPKKDIDTLKTFTTEARFAAQARLNATPAAAKTNIGNPLVSTVIDFIKKNPNVRTEQDLFIGISKEAGQGLSNSEIVKAAVRAHRNGSLRLLKEGRGETLGPNQLKNIQNINSDQLPQVLKTLFNIFPKQISRDFTGTVEDFYKDNPTLQKRALQKLKDYGNIRKQVTDTFELGKKGLGGAAFQFDHPISFAALKKSGDLEGAIRTNPLVGDVNQWKTSLDKKLNNLQEAISKGKDVDANLVKVEKLKNINQTLFGKLAGDFTMDAKGKINVIDYGAPKILDPQYDIAKSAAKNIPLGGFIKKTLASGKLTPELTEVFGEKSATNLINRSQKLIEFARKDTNRICRIFGGAKLADGGQGCAIQMTRALDEDPIGTATKVQNLQSEGGSVNRIKNAASSFLNFAKKGGKFGAIAAAGAAAAGLVKTFMNDDPTTYLSNEDQQKNMLISMVTNPIDDTPQESPEILDYQLPTLGAVTAAGMIPGGKRVYDVRRRGGVFPTKDGTKVLKPAGPVRSALGLKGVLGKGLAATATPLGLAALEPLHIAAQIQSGDSLTDIATNPWNYAGPAFASSLTKEATRFASPMASKIMRMGLSPTALRGLSRFGGYGLAASLGIQGLQKFDDWRNKRGWFSEE